MATSSNLKYPPGLHPPPPPLKKDKGKRTTLWLYDSTKQMVKEFGNKGETYDEILRRLMSGIGDIDVEFLAIDRESPSEHTAILRLGTFHYLWNKETFKEISKSRLKTVVSIEEETDNKEPT